VKGPAERPDAPALAPRAEAEATEEKFSNFFRNSSVPFSISRLADGLFLEVNEAFARMFGWSREEVLGKTAIDIGMTPDAATRAKTIRAVAAGAPFEESLLEVPTKGGGAVSALVSMTRLQWGGQACIASIFSDLTARKKAEARLRESEERLRLLVEGTRDYAIFMLDPQGMVATWNEGARRIKGYTEAEAVGTHFSRFYPPEDVAAGKPERELRIATETGLYQEEGIRVRKDGTRFWANVTITPLRGQDGRLRGFSKVTQDITQRKEVERSLRESEAKFSAFFHNSLLPFAITLLADGTYLEANDAFTRTLGWTREELLGRRPHELGIVADPATRAEAVKGVAAEGHVPARAVQLKAKDGHTVEAIASMTRIRWAGRECIAAGFADVTEQKRTEASLEAANQELDAFAYSVSHDLRAPLRSMSGFAQILLEDHAGQLPPDARHDIDMIIDSAREMGELVDDLLAFSRLGKQPLAKEAVEPGRIARQVLDELRAGQKGPRDVRVRFGEMPACQADPALLRQVFANLLSNALKYTRKREHAEVEVGWTPEGGGAYFVRDNGVGFDMKHADKLFGVFQRLHRAEDYEGTGVGLAIVQRIVQRHGGRVWAQAAVDQGATFFLTLPGGPAHG
jgi:PAS domain S-box-containing protein